MGRSRITCCFTLFSLIASVSCHHDHGDHQHVHDHFHSIVGHLLQGRSQNTQAALQREELIGPKSDILYGPSIISLTKYNRKVHGPTLLNPDAGRFIHLEDYPNFSVTVPLGPENPDERSNNVFISRHLSGPGQFQVVAPEGHGVMAVIQSMELRTAGAGCHDFIQFGDYDSGVETRGTCGKVEKRDGSVTPASLMGPRVFVAPSGRMKVLFYHGFVWGLVRDFNFDLLDPSRNPILRVELVFTAYKECDDPDQGGYKSCTGSSGPGSRTCIRPQLFCDSVLNCGFEENFGSDEGVTNCLQTSLLNLLLPRVLTAASSNPNLFWALANANRFSVGHEEEGLSRSVPEVESPSPSFPEWEKVGSGEIVSIPISTDAPLEEKLSLTVTDGPILTNSPIISIPTTTEPLVIDALKETTTGSIEVTTQLSPISTTHELEPESPATTPYIIPTTTASELPSIPITAFTTPTPTTTTTTTTERTTRTSRASTIETTATPTTTVKTSSTVLTYSTSITAKPYRESKAISPPQSFTVLSEASKKIQDRQGPFRVQLHRHFFNASQPTGRISPSSTLKEVTHRPLLVLIGQKPVEKGVSSSNSSHFIQTQTHAVSEISRDYDNSTATNPLIDPNSRNSIAPTKSSTKNMTLGNSTLFAEEGEGQTEQLHTELFDVTEMASYPTGSSQESSAETDLAGNSSEEDNDEPSVTLWIMLTILLAVAILLMVRIYFWNHRVIWVPNPQALRARRKKKESSVYANVSPSNSPRLPGLHKPSTEKKGKETPPSYDILLPTQNSLHDADMLP